MAAPVVIAAALLGAATVFALAIALWRTRRSATALELERRRTADELNRRLSELFSLQELSYVLSDSLVLERIVEQVARYSLRFLDARGALVALAGEEPGTPLRILGAHGSLGVLAGHAVSLSDPGIIARSVVNDRLELGQNPTSGAVIIAGDIVAPVAAAVPLRAHGATVGTLVVAEPRNGIFETHQVRLLSTVATHAAVVLSNARFFAMVERAKVQWESVFDALREGIAVVDDEGRVRRANRAWAELLGKPIEQVVGQHLSAALPEAAGLAQLTHAAKGAESPPPFVARSESLGRTLRILASHIPSAGSGQSAVVLAEDVTEQQAMEAQLIQSEKLAAVGQLVSGVAHELNNPLTSIAGLSEFLLEQREVSPKDRGHLQVIHEQAERAGRIVRNLLTFARKGPAEEARVDLGDVVRRTLLLMSYDLKLKDVDLKKELASDLPEVLGDRHALQQLVLNLLTNAAQAVSANPPEKPRRIHVRTWFDGNVHLRVTDTGPGIPDDVAPHVFTPFFTTKDPGQGTGLGLSISYSIVEAHRGHITLERSSGDGGGGGAIFRVDLPPALKTVAEDATPGVESTPAELSPVRRSILLVDDDPAVGRLIKAFFGREGHAVEVARTSRHALDLVGARPFDLVIADGRATTQRRLLVEELLDRHPQIKSRLVVATGDVRPSTEEALHRLGVRYLRKPFNLRLLRDEAARVWALPALS